MPDAAAQRGIRRPSRTMVMAAAAVLVLLVAVVGYSLRVLPDPFSPGADANKAGSEVLSGSLRSPQGQHDGAGTNGVGSQHPGSKGAGSRGAGVGGHQGGGSTSVTDHGPAPRGGGAPSPSPSGSAPTLDSCLIGTWKATLLEIYVTNGDIFSNWNGVGVYTESIASNGSFNVEYTADNNNALNSDNSTYNMNVTGSVTGSETTADGEEHITYGSNNSVYSYCADYGSGSCTNENALDLSAAESYTCSANTLSETMPDTQTLTMTRSS